MRWLSLALVATLLGCVSSVRPPTNFESAEAALAAVEQDVQAGRWQTAIEKLQVAERQFVGEPALPARRSELSARWVELRAEWEDRLALVRAQGRRDELKLLQRLNVAETGDLFGKLQLEQKKTLLLRQHSELIACAQRQLDRDLELAQSCADLAYEVRNDEAVRELHEEIAAKQAAETIARQDQREAELAKFAAEQAQKRKIAKVHRSRKLDQASRLAKDEQYVRALALVQQVLEDEPDNRRAMKLRAGLQESLAKQSRVLSDLADRLYSESNVDAAIRIWEASLRLVPDQPDVVERYERAKKVQDNLEELRARPGQSPGAGQKTGP